MKKTIFGLVEELKSEKWVIVPESAVERFHAEAERQGLYPLGGAFFAPTEWDGQGCGKGFYLE